MTDRTASGWVLCPFCGGKTRLKIREDTLVYKLPLFCPKCKRESLVNIRKFNVTTEPDATTQSL